MKFSECSSRDRAWIVIGAVLVVLGVAMLLGTYTTWWTALFGLIRRISRLAVPIALIAVGAYVVWGARNNRFAHLFARSGLRRENLTRSVSDYRIAGVCGGIAQYFDIDSMFVRVVAVLLAIASPLLTIATYGMLTLVLREKS